MRFRNPFRRPVPPRRYFTILTVQGHDADGTLCVSTRRNTYVIDWYTTDSELHDTALADLLKRDAFIVGDAAVLFWYVMTEDVSL